MGRHRNLPDKDGNIRREKYVKEADRNGAVLDRLGCFDQVCTDCNATNPEDADKCRKCGCTNLRRKASHPGEGYRDE